MEPIEGEASIFWDCYGATVTDNHLMPSEYPSDADGTLPIEIAPKYNPVCMATSFRCENPVEEPVDYYFVQANHFRVPEDWGDDTMYQ